MFLLDEESIAFCESFCLVDALLEIAEFLHQVVDARLGTLALQKFGHLLVEFCHYLASGPPCAHDAGREHAVAYTLRGEGVECLQLGEAEPEHGSEQSLVYAAQQAA